MQPTIAGMISNALTNHGPLVTSTWVLSALPSGRYPGHNGVAPLAPLTSHQPINSIRGFSGAIHHHHWSTESPRLTVTEVSQRQKC